MEAFQIIQTARMEGITNPDHLLARLTGHLPGMTVARAQEILVKEGLQPSPEVAVTRRRSGCGGWASDLDDPRPITDVSELRARLARRRK